MNRKFTILGVVLTAAFAFTAIAATSASAFTEWEFPEAGTTAFKGVQTEKLILRTNPGTLECTSHVVRGMVSAPKQPTIEVSESTATSGEEVGKKGEEYSGCTFIGLIGVAVKPNCGFFYKFSGEVDVVPEAGECVTTGLTFEAIGCRVQIKAQKGLKSAIFANAGAGSGRTVSITPSISGITYTASGCPSGNGTFSNGTYTGGKIVVSAFTNTNSGKAPRAVVVV